MTMKNDNLPMERIQELADSYFAMFAEPIKKEYSNSLELKSKVHSLLDKINHYETLVKRFDEEFGVLCVFFKPILGDKPLLVLHYTPLNWIDGEFEYLSRPEYSFNDRYYLHNWLQEVWSLKCTIAQRKYNIAIQSIPIHPAMGNTPYPFPSQYYDSRI